MIACARLIRASLPIDRVAGLAHGDNPVLAKAAELYLESEDSPEARLHLLSLHPEKAKITGATTLFPGGAGAGGSNPGWEDGLGPLFASVSPFYSSAEYTAGAAFAEDFSALEKRLQAEVIDDDDLLGVYAYDSYFIRIYSDRAVFSWEEDAARYRERILNADEFEGLREYLAHNNVADLAPFLECAYCDSKQLLMVGRTGGRRVFVKADRMPPFFAGLDNIFKDLKRPPMKLKYAAAKEFPGLEILFADDDLLASAVWKNGADMRLLIVDRRVRARVKKEIDDAFNAAIGGFDGDAPDPEEPDNAERENPHLQMLRMTEKRALEGISWFSFNNGELAGATASPSGIDYPVPIDNHSVRPTAERWKARAGDIEIRANEEGVFKIRGGKMTKIRSGHYLNPVVSPNGRWLVATKYDYDEGSQLVRVNLATNREFVIDVGDSSADHPVVFIPSVNRFLLGAVEYDEYDHHYEEVEEIGEDGDTMRITFRPGMFRLLDAETGRIGPTAGELRPLAQQYFRPLQPTGKAHEFWAAITDAEKNETSVGRYDSQLFGFTPVVRLPKILFDSLDMWVDQADGKVYFVYRGHLLAAPLARQ
jgi:hypothetical protein